MPPSCWPGCPHASLSRIDLIHPDPWPKRRHWKRRFVQDATIAAMARVLKPGGEFRFVCDIDDYCAWTLSHLARSPDFIWIAERADDLRLPWAGYTMTRYGRKAEREGRKAAYLRFRRTARSSAGCARNSPRARRSTASGGRNSPAPLDDRHRPACGAARTAAGSARAPSPIRDSMDLPRIRIGS